MLGFSSLASAPLGDDGLKPVDFLVDQIQGEPPTVDSPDLSQLHKLNLTLIAAGSPAVDTSTITQNHIFIGGLALGAVPFFRGPRLLGTPALSRVDIDGPAIFIVNDSIGGAIVGDSDSDALIEELATSIST